MNPDCMLPVSPPQFKVTASQGGQCVNTDKSLKKYWLDKGETECCDLQYKSCWLLVKATETYGSPFPYVTKRKGKKSIHNSKQVIFSKFWLINLNFWEK